MSSVLAVTRNLLKLGVKVYSYKDHCSFGSFLPSLLVGVSSTNSTRASEPALSLNQLHGVTAIVIVMPLLSRVILLLRQGIRGNARIGAVSMTPAQSAEGQ